MLLAVSGKTIVCKFPRNFLTTKSKKSTIISARKQDFPQNSETAKKPLIEFKFSNRILAQSAIAVLGLGFIDAGYSGDWSRIGAISKENEDVLKISAFVVVPLCLFLIFWLSKNPENQ